MVEFQKRAYTFRRQSSFLFVARLDTDRGSIFGRVSKLYKNWVSWVGSGVYSVGLLGDHGGVVQGVDRGDGGGHAAYEAGRVPHVRGGRQVLVRDVGAVPGD